MSRSKRMQVVRKILAEFKEEVKRILKKKFVDIILFGSFAREDYEFGSDIDVLVLVKEKLNKKEDEDLSSVASKLSLEYEMVISYFDYLYENFTVDETPFLMNVRREGIRI